MNFYESGRTYHGENHHSYKDVDEAWEECKKENPFIDLLSLKMQEEEFERFGDGWSDKCDEVLDND